MSDDDFSSDVLDNLEEGKQLTQKRPDLPSHHCIEISDIIMEDDEEEDEEDDEEEAVEEVEAEGEADDDEEEISGCDPDEPYYPFNALPTFESRRYKRMEALQEWIGANEDGTLRLGDQSLDESDPLVLPVVARFSFKCVRQTSAELGKPLAKNCG